MPSARHRTFALLALALLATPGPTRGDEAVAGAALSIPPAGRESGRSIYRRFLEQRLRESFQRLRVISKDPGGSALTTGFSISTQDHRDANQKATDGIFAKVLIQVFDPFDLRHTLYLIISKDPGPDDEFIYRPSQGSVNRRKAQITTPTQAARATSRWTRSISNTTSTANAAATTHSTPSSSPL